MTSAQAYAIRAEIAARLTANGCTLEDLVTILRLGSKEDARKLIGRYRSLRRTPSQLAYVNWRPE